MSLFYPLEMHTEPDTVEMVSDASYSGSESDFELDAGVTTTKKRGPGRPIGVKNKARRLDEDDGPPCTPYALNELIGYLPQNDPRLRDFEVDLHIKLNRDASGSNPRWDESELLTAGLDTVRAMSDFQLCDTKADGTPQYLKLGDPLEPQFLMVSFQRKLDVTCIMKVTVVLERGAAANPKLRANSVRINGVPTRVAFPAYFAPSFVAASGNKYTYDDYDPAVYACLEIAQRYMFDLSKRNKVLNAVVQDTMVKWFHSADGEDENERWMRVVKRDGLCIGGGNGNAFDSNLLKGCNILALGMATLAKNTLEGSPFLYDALSDSLNAPEVVNSVKKTLPWALSGGADKSSPSEKAKNFVPSVIHTANGPSSVPVRVRVDQGGRSVTVPVVLDIGQKKGEFILREGDGIYLPVHASSESDTNLKMSVEQRVYLQDNIDNVKKTEAIWEEDYPLDDERGVAQRRAMRSVVLAHAMAIPFSQAVLCADAMLTRPAGKCVLAHINEQVPCVRGSEQEFAREQLFLLWEIGSIAMNTADNKSTKLILFVGGPGCGKTEMVKNLTRWAGGFVGKAPSDLLQLKGASDKPRPEIATMDGAHVVVIGEMNTEIELDKQTCNNLLDTAGLGGMLYRMLFSNIVKRAKPYGLIIATANDALPDAKTNVTVDPSRGNVGLARRRMEMVFKRTFLEAGKPGGERRYTNSSCDTIVFDDGALTCPKDPKISALLGTPACLTETLRLMAMAHQDNALFDAPPSDWTVVSPTIIHAPIRQEFRWGAAAERASVRRKMLSSTFFRAFTEAFDFNATLFGENGREWTREKHNMAASLSVSLVKPMWNKKLELDGAKDLKYTMIMGKDEKERFQKCWQNDVDAIAAWCMFVWPSLPASFSLPKEVIVETGKRKGGKVVYEIRLYGFVPKAKGTVDDDEDVDDEASGAGASTGVPVADV